jgi:phosphoribosyl 1,2-cyclic phosphodiesterase
VRLYLCGVRGSTPAPGADFLRYGGHTSCVAIAHDDDARPTLVLDAGTGLRQVTPLLGGQPFDGTILLTHLHWDHVHGLPFFTGGDREGSRVSLLLPEQEDGATAEQALAKGMSPPHFPIGPSELRGAWTFGTVAPGQLKAEGFTIEARAIPHKGGATLGYRVSDGSSVIAYLPDHCPTALGPGPEGWGEYHAAALELASDADVLLHDAFLLADEVPAEAFFGHAAIDYAIGLGRRAGARRVVLTHHKPGRTDAALDEVASRVAGVRGEVASRVAAVPGDVAGRVAGAPGEMPGRPAQPEVIVAAEGEIFEL